VLVFNNFSNPQLGRWWQIDPEVEQFEAWSAYNSNLDNPIRYEDKDGDCPKCLKALGKTLVKSVVKGKVDLGEVYDMVDGVMTLVSPTTSGLEKAEAAFNLLSPVSTKEIKGIAKVAGVVNDADKVKDGAKVVDKAKPVEIKISKSKYPEAAKHIEEATQNGHPSTGKIDRAGAANRRKESLKNTPTVKGKDRDEFPPAVLNTGGKGASVKTIKPSDNRGAGSSMGNQMKKLPNGTEVKIVVDK